MQSRELEAVKHGKGTEVQDDFAFCFLYDAATPRGCHSTFLTPYLTTQTTQYPHSLQWTFSFLPVATARAWQSYLSLRQHVTK